MKKKITQLLSWCSEYDFGDIQLSEQEYEFYSRFNNEILSLCKTLPKTVQTEAFLFFSRYSGLSLGKDYDFFGNFYKPTWSIIFWLIESNSNHNRFTENDIQYAITAHSMAMSLHSLDDHLCDNELPVTHLALLLRSQAWVRMNNAIDSLVQSLTSCSKLVETYLAEYYSAVCSSSKIDSLNDYCAQFKKQMGTGMIVPVIVTKLITDHEAFSHDISSAFLSFGVAWRLLDDIKDFQLDLMEGNHSAVYLSLPKKIRKLWDFPNKNISKFKNRYVNDIYDYIIKNHIIYEIEKLICSELESAVLFADYHNISGLADDFRSLLKPMQIRQAIL